MSDPDFENDKGRPGQGPTHGGRPPAGSGGRGNHGGGPPPGDLPALRGGEVAAARGHAPIAFSPSSGYGEPPIVEERLDLRKYLWLLLRHRWLIAGSVGVFLCLGLLVTFLMTPVYRASATIQIDRDAAEVVNFDSVDAVDGGRDVEFYQTQYELLKSRSLAERVVTELNLQDDTRFLAADAPSPWTRLRQLLFGGQSASASADVDSRQASAAGRIMRGLTVEPVRNSTIVKLGFDSPDPRLAQRIVNAVAETYIAVNLERRYEASAYAREFLEERLQQLKVKLEESEKELVAYAEAQELVSAGDNQNLSMTNLAAANDELARVTKERLRKEQLWRQVENSEGIGLPQIMENEAIKAMRARRVELAGEYQDKLSVYKPAFPEMKQLQAQINELDRQIKDEIALIKETTAAEYEAAVNEEKSLAALVDSLKAEVTDVRNRNIRYNILQREVDTNRTLYEGLLQRYKEIGVAGGVGVNNVSIVDEADTPGAPYTPRLPVNLAFALMLGLMVGGGTAFLREHFDDTFKSPEDVEDDLGLPLLGVIPYVKQFDSRSEMENQRSPLVEAYRSLRTALQFSTSDGVPRSLLVTSSRASEGKSTTAMMLARNFAQLGMRVLLIDADLRKPSLHNHLEIDPNIGLSNILSGPTVPPEALQKTDVPGLTALGAGPLPPNPAELLASGKMLSLLTVAGQEYDLVIIDGPPVAGLADSPLLASMTAGTLLIIDAKGTRKAIAKAALKRLHFARAQVIGAAVNKLDLSSMGYGYGYGYGYGDEYYGYAAQLPDARKADTSGQQTGA